MGKKINGTTTRFGVSGLLYNSNVIPYDRLTNSNWSQIAIGLREQETYAKRKRRRFMPSRLPGKPGKTMFPETKVVISRLTCLSRNYSNYP
ncbi:MAG: DUF3179 domain-containing (seleno)protein [Cytophagales bacterium]|nr:DUF3179 domain-containing (seleno)protein [Cytophagales bacterium]